MSIAFPNPHNASRVALVMDIRPLIPAGMFSGIALDPNVLYQFKIANYWRSIQLV